MLPSLDDREIRVLGCLLEKAIFTPDVYPLTLNSLVLACNQKSSREPVMTLSPVEVQRAARDLEAKSFVKREENFRNGIEKYEQRFCNTPFGAIKLDAAEYAVMTLLLLRGPQTPGEIKSRSGRLHEFGSNEEVALTLQRLIDRPAGALVARLPRQPQRQDHEYAHLLGDKLESVEVEAVAQASSDRPARGREIEARLEALEQDVAMLKKQLGIE